MIDRISGRKIVSVRGRAFAIDMQSDALARVQAGVFKTRYKGLAFLKNPFDVVLYMQLLQALKPQTIIEVGSYEGGSAVWFRDQVRALELNATVISIDIAPPQQSFAGVEFCTGDAMRADETFPHELIAVAPHPWLVIEDSAHTYETTKGSLGYFDRLLAAGDYLVVEDGSVADLPVDEYGRFEDGPNRAVAELLNTSGGRYAIDAAYCDYYGHNVTYCPNAWLARV